MGLVARDVISQQGGNLVEQINFFPGALTIQNYGPQIFVDWPQNYMFLFSILISIIITNLENIHNTKINKS